MKMESSTNGAITLCRYEILWIQRTCDYIQLNGWSDCCKPSVITACCLVVGLGLGLA